MLNCGEKELSFIIYWAKCQTIRTEKELKKYIEYNKYFYQNEVQFFIFLYALLSIVKMYIWAINNLPK